MHHQRDFYFKHLIIHDEKFFFAVTLLARGGVAGTPADGPALLAAVWECPAALALLAFAASEEHFTLRQRLRVAVA
ncbi:MAG TPA: hypothetical protein VFP50_07995 [Anaeromyxobacteraceae bacterium]|nr:hypothetical protein [Anaeromyxobacteraceae bacterium]